METLNLEKTYRYTSTVCGFLVGGSHLTSTECESIISIRTFCGTPGSLAKK